jgi:hypothetical protein
MSVIRKYSGSLEAETSTHDKSLLLERLETLGMSNTLVKAYSGFVDVSYEGRDTGGIIRLFLIEELPALVPNLEGEITCEIHDDDDLDPRFEYIRFEAGQVYIQQGEIVRGPAKLAHDADGP